MLVLERLHESHPDLFTMQIIVSAWEDMTFRYTDAVKEGTRKMVRMLPETVRKGGIPTEGTDTNGGCPFTLGIPDDSLDGTPDGVLAVHRYPSTRGKGVKINAGSFLGSGAEEISRRRR